MFGLVTYILTELRLFKYPQYFHLLGEINMRSQGSNYADNPKERELFRIKIRKLPLIKTGRGHFFDLSEILLDFYKMTKNHQDDILMKDVKFGGTDDYR